MATATLVNYEIEEGQRLIDALQAKGVGDAALWIYSSEKEKWQLMVTSPKYDRLGPLKAYDEILSVFREITPELRIDWTALVAVSPKHELIQGLRKWQNQFNFDLSGRRISNNIVEGFRVDDAYIYQIK
jgi:hypothetical protein